MTQTSHDPEPLDGDYFALRSTCEQCRTPILWRIGLGEWEHVESTH